jgi:hypothetical protein
MHLHRFIITLVFLSGICSFSQAQTNLTFTAHPTNIHLGNAMYNPKDEINYYNQYLKNIAYVLLYDGHEHVEDIGNFYSWIGYDFDRSNLTAVDVAYAYNENIALMIDVYKEYIVKCLNNDVTLSSILNRLSFYVSQVKILITNKDLEFDNFIKQFQQISKSFELKDLEAQFATRLAKLSEDKADTLLHFFNKFRFQLVRGQVRFSGPDIMTDPKYIDVLKVMSIINATQDYAISEIVIANFSSIKQIAEIKGLKDVYRLTNLATIPLVETEKDVDYLLANLEEIMASDRISQIMKAGSDDTKFSGMASSILNFAKVGRALERLNSKDKPIFFIGMGTSLERSGGPNFYRKMLASIMGKNETNRTIQGGELEKFKTPSSALIKLEDEIEISNSNGHVSQEDVEVLSSAFKDTLIGRYQSLYNDADRRATLDYLIKDSSLAFVMDNFQAGSRYKRKITLDESGKLVNKFQDLFEDTRAIDFQTTFALSGLHPEFVSFDQLTTKEEDFICRHKSNPILRTYITGLTALRAQINPDFYQALGLDVKQNFYKSVLSGVDSFDKVSKSCFKDLKDEIASELDEEQYLDYSQNSHKAIVDNLSKQHIAVGAYRAKEINFTDLQKSLYDLNKDTALRRNLLGVAVKN